MVFSSIATSNVNSMYSLNRMGHTTVSVRLHRGFAQADAEPECKAADRERGL